MTEETEIRIPLDELTRVSIECNRCGSESLIDISREEHRRIENHERPMKCPFCGTPFDSKLRDSFTNLFTWRDLAKDSRHKVSFRIKRG